MDLWEAVGICAPGVIACCGAGGKTSLLTTLCRLALLQKLPVIMTTTTKVYYRQIAQLQPVLQENYAAGLAELIQNGGNAWSLRQEGEKVIGLPPEWIDRLSEDRPDAFILVEADGAAGRLLKAPAKQEPVIPDRTSITIGVVNAGVIGLPLDDSSIHRLALVLSILGKQAGQLVEANDIASLALHPSGLFQYSRGRKVLLLTGVESINREVWSIIEALRITGSDISCCITASGWGEAMKPTGVFRLDC